MQSCLSFVRPATFLLYSFKCLPKLLLVNKGLFGHTDCSQSWQQCLLSRLMVTEKNENTGYSLNKGRSEIRLFRLCRYLIQENTGLRLLHTVILTSPLPMLSPNEITISFTVKRESSPFMAKWTSSSRRQDKGITSQPHWPRPSWLRPPGRWLK